MAICLGVETCISEPSLSTWPISQEHLWFKTCRWASFLELQYSTTYKHYWLCFGDVLPSSFPPPLFCFLLSGCFSFKCPFWARSWLCLSFLFLPPLPCPPSPGPAKFVNKFGVHESGELMGLPGGGHIYFGQVLHTPLRSACWETSSVPTCKHRWQAGLRGCCQVLITALTDTAGLTMPAELMGVLSEIHLFIENPVFA